MRGPESVKPTVRRSPVLFFIQGFFLHMKPRTECSDMDEATLIEKLLKIESLFAGAATEGERTSAERSRQRILKRLDELLPQDPPVEYKFTF